MQFYDAIITNEGVRMLTAASFSNKLTFTRLLFCADNVTLGVTTQSLEHSWGNGHIDNYASADDGSFVIYGSASNAQDYGMAYGFAVYGYLNSEGPENEHIVFVANADGVPTYVNSQSGAATRFQFAIKAKINLSDQVIRIDPNYNGLVSNMAFQDLLERTVTTHSATDPMVGDNQVVRGRKRFYDTTYFGGDSNDPYIEIAVDGDNGSMYLNAEHESQQIRIQMKPKDYGDDSNNNVYVNTNISPSGDGLVSLGVNEHRWFEINTYSLWASDTVGVSNQYGSTGVGPERVEFLNGEGDSIGTIGLNNDGTQLLIEGNGGPVHIASLTVDNGMSVVGSAELQGTTYARSLLWANDNIRCDGSITISSVTLTGDGNVLRVNKSTTISGNVTCAQLFMTSNVMGINGAGGEPYYIGVNNGVLQIGMNNSGTTISGGGLKVSSLNTASATISTLTIGGIAYQAGFDHPALIENETQDAISEIPVGSIFLAAISEDPQSQTNYRAGAITNTITRIRTIQLVPENTNLGTLLTVQVGSEFTPDRGMEFQVLNNTPRSGGIALVMRIR